MKILRYDDAENTWEPRKHLAHLNVFNDYIAQKKSGESSQKKKTGSSHSTPKKDVKKYAPKSSNALSSTRAKKVDDDEQSGEDQQKDKEEGEDGDHKETVEMDDSGKGIQPFLTVCYCDEARVDGIAGVA